MFCRMMGQNKDYMSGEARTGNEPLLTVLTGNEPLLIFVSKG